MTLHASYLPFGHVPGWLSNPVPKTAELSLVELESRQKALDQAQQAERALVVTWLLMGQTLTNTEEQRASKASAKRIARLDPNLLTAVRYVKLRHRSPAVSDHEAGDGGGRTYRHRWVVGGHWRNQYFPSRKDHRPIWIDDHIKGPSGAPSSTRTN